MTRGDEVGEITLDAHLQSEHTNVQSASRNKREAWGWPTWRPEVQMFTDFIGAR